MAEETTEEELIVDLLNKLGTSLQNNHNDIIEKRVSPERKKIQ